MEFMFKNETQQRKHELFGHDPNTEKISSIQFEQLLKMTNEALLQHFSRDTIAQRLTPYAGPQCNEDREYKERLHYNVNFSKEL